MKMRINNIELRWIQSKKYTFEIVKWKENSYYKKLDQFKANGYSIEKEFAVKGNNHIDLKLFDLKETCYVIAFITKNNELQIVGNRLFKLKKNDFKDFKLVWKLFFKRL